MKTEIFDTSLIDVIFNLEGEQTIEVEENGTKFTLDINKTSDNEINIKITRSNSDKKEFEKWANDIDDDLFTEAWESLSKDFNLKDLNDVYDSDDYHQVINIFKDRVKTLAQNKINNLQKYLG